MKRKYARDDTPAEWRGFNALVTLLESFRRGATCSVTEQSPSVSDPRIH